MRERVGLELEVIDLGLDGNPVSRQEAPAAGRYGELESPPRETPQGAACRKKWEALLASLPPEVKAALDADRKSLAVIAAIHAGLRDANKLTDLLFFTGWGLARGYCRIGPNERDPSGKKLADWWLELRQKYVLPALQLPSPKLAQTGGIACTERAVKKADPAPDARPIDLTGTYEHRTPGQTPREIVRINQAGTHVECLFRRLARKSDPGPAGSVFLFGDRQENGTYLLFQRNNPKTLALLKPARNGVAVAAGKGQSFLQLMNGRSAHLLPNLADYADELVWLHEQRPISHAQMQHLIDSLAPSKIEPYLADYFRQSPDDRTYDRGARLNAGNNLDLYLKKVFEDSDLGFVKTDKKDVVLVSFYARSLLSEAKWKNGDIRSHLDWIQRIQSRMLRDGGGIRWGEDWLGLKKLPADLGPKNVYRVDVDLKGGGLFVHGYVGTITFEKISDDTPSTRWKKGERHSYGCRLVGIQAGETDGFQQTGVATVDYEWQPRDIPGPIRVAQAGVSAEWGAASASVTGGFLHIEGSQQFPMMPVTFEKFDKDFDIPEAIKRRNDEPSLPSLRLGPGGFFGSIRPQAFPTEDLSTPPEKTDYSVMLGLQQDVHFCLDSALLTEDARQALRIMIARELPAFESKLSVLEITGHTDRSVPPNLPAAQQQNYNRILSELRAENTWQAIKDIVGPNLAIIEDDKHLIKSGLADTLAARQGDLPGKVNPKFRRVDVRLNARLVLTLRAQVP